MEQTVQGLQRQKDVFQLIHGDFSLDQVVENQGKLHLLDWDRCAAGNPLMDLATFTARLEFQVIEGFYRAGKPIDWYRLFFTTINKTPMAI